MAHATVQAQNRHCIVKADFHWHEPLLSIIVTGELQKERKKKIA
jgi:hypothetical protein